MATVSKSKTYKLQASERARRQRAFRSAVSSVRMEGLKVSASTSRIARQYQSGAITAAEMVALVKAQFKNS